jgi:hypothetical protein
MKNINIQTGNDIITLDPYLEYHQGYAIEVVKAHDGYKASIRDCKAKYAIEVIRGYPCIDDALQGLGV